MNIKINFSKIIVLIGAILLTACQSQSPINHNLLIQPQFRMLNESESSTDRFLCSVQKGATNSLIKSMDLKTNQIRSVFVPGQVQTLSGSQTSQKLYAGNENGQVYEIDIQTNAVKYFTSFSQVALSSVDFVVNNQTLYAVGLIQGQSGSLMSMDLQQKTWKPIAYNVKPGRLSWNGSQQSLQILNMAVENVSRTTVNVNNRQVVKEELSYTTQNDENNFYNGVFSPGGQYLFASVNNRVERFKKEGNQLVRLTPIELNHVKARYLALSNDGKILYVTHNQPHRLTRVRLGRSSSSAGYSIEEMAFAGTNNQLVVF